VQNRKDKASAKKFAQYVLLKYYVYGNA